MSRPEFTKKDLLEHAVPDFDDYGDKNNGLNYLNYIKWKYPKFKVTLFAVPFWWGESQESFFRYTKQFDWIQLGVHGWEHPHPREALHWKADKINEVLDECERWGVFEKIFKAPGWQINDDIYKVLNERGYTVADQHYNKGRQPENLKIYCTCHPWMVHGHVQNVRHANPIYRNGLEQFIEEHGLPFNQDTKFYFIEEALKLQKNKH